MRLTSTLELAMTLWVFGSEVITQTDLCTSPLKLEGKRNPNLEDSTSAQRDSSWFLIPLGWESHFRGQMPMRRT